MHRPPSPAALMSLASFRALVSDRGAGCWMNRDSLVPKSTSCQHCLAARAGARVQQPLHTVLGPCPRTPARQHNAFTQASNASKQGDSSGAGAAVHLREAPSVLAMHQHHARHVS